MSGDRPSKVTEVSLSSFKRPTLVEVKGVTMVDNIEENWDSLWAFQAKPDDLLICTYPKAGTTWMQEIVDILQHGGDPGKCAQVPIFHRIPFLEKFQFSPTGLEELEAMPSPRIIKTHLPVQLLPPSFWEQNCKMIYVARNGKDTAVSYFHFHRMNHSLPEPTSWNQFLEDFLAGKIAWGSWFDHVRGWWDAKGRHPILYVFYEDMKENPAREIQRVAQFLGLELTESILNQIVQHTKFENMKKNPLTNYTAKPRYAMDHTVSPFMRKGTTGDWKEHFTVAQSEQLDNICDHLLGGSGLTFRTVL
ncbi:sulfotransferase 1C2-like [Sceloporus undulatus]|uniref:sulfotransferase 1C2-like n=1 Tax=Sceloporus undulatus TaxID=8520 RepID=UPI001C4B8A93|nr:sulfotransferase 1C2-like [Sceloporus undulatus]